jgi:predicted lipoprotein with Yx(FWY)xxD motif
MRTYVAAIGALAALLTASAVAAEDSIEKMPYPSAFALSQDNGKWLFKSFPTFMPLYTFDGEPSGKSTCDDICVAVWPIIKAEPDAKPIGVWTVIKRDDGRLQWAYKGKPLYTYFEDSPNYPRGVGKTQDWYLDDGAYAYLTRVGVVVGPPPKKTASRTNQKVMTARLLDP